MSVWSCDVLPSGAEINPQPLVLNFTFQNRLSLKCSPATSTERTDVNGVAALSTVATYRSTSNRKTFKETLYIPLSVLEIQNVARPETYAR